MRRDPGSGLEFHHDVSEQLALMAIAQREAEQEAFAAAQESGRGGVLVLHLDGGADTYIGVHTGVPKGRTWISDREPQGKYIEKTVRRFHTSDTLV